MAKPGRRSRAELALTGALMVDVARQMPPAPPAAGLAIRKAKSGAIAWRVCRGTGYSAARMRF